MATNNMFWTWFWPSFWNTGWNNQQLNKPTKQQKFPWLSDDQIKRLESLTSNPQEQQKLYQQAIQQLQNQNIADNRFAAENELNYRSLWQKDTRQANYMQSNSRLEQLADLAKNAYWLNANAGTQDVINWLMSMAQDNWVSLDLLNDYLDHGDEEFLYQMGLAQPEEVQQPLSLKASMASNEWGEWNDNLLGRFEIEQYDENAGFWKNAGTFWKNLLKSGVNVLSDVWNMVLNPLDTAWTLAKTAVWGAMNLFGIDEDIKYMQDWKLKDWYMSANDTADTVWEFFKERYGGGDEILNTLFTDPIGVVSDVASIIEWWAGALRWIAKGGAKASAKAWLKATARALDKASDVVGTVWKTAGYYDPYAIAMRAETQLPIKAISATVDSVKKIPWASKKLNLKLNEALDSAIWLDQKTKQAIQSNPFSKEVWAKAKTYIDANWLPEKSTEVSKQLITDVADRVQDVMLKQMDELSETWPMYQPLREAWFTVDLSSAKAKLPEILEEYGITVNENGKLDFSKSSISSEASDIQKIYNWIENTDWAMSMDEYLRLRKTASDMVNYNPNNKNYIWKKVADTPWDKVIKAIREAANETAHEQVAPLKDLDNIYNKQVSLIQEVTDWIVYKDKSKMGAVRDNINQIIKNLDEPNRRVLKNRLEKVLPWIEEEVKAINMLPKLIDNYYKPSKLQQTITSSAWAAVWGAIGSIPWGILGAWAWYLVSKWIDKLKSSKWDKIISETSKDGASKMADIQKRIANNQKITQAQKAFLNEISEKLKAGKLNKEWEVARIVSDILSAEEWKELAVIDKALKDLETIGAKDEVKDLKKYRADVVKELEEKAEMERAKADFELEKEQILSESSDQRLPEFKKRIYQLQQEEMRVWRVAGNKIWKTFEWRDWKKTQDINWLKKKEAIIKDIQDYYNVDQFEASEIFDRIERQAWPDDLGFNGKQASSKTAKYQVADQTQTPEFKKWFKGSKVVNEDGTPKVVYHWADKLATHNKFNKSINWFTDSETYAGEAWVAKSLDNLKKKPYLESKYYEDSVLNPKLYKTYLNISNPLVVDGHFALWDEIKTPTEMWGKWTKTTDQIASWAKRNWYDGVIFKNVEENWKNTNQYAVFNSNQIKSATDNIWTFDKNNPDIRYQKYWTAWANEKSISAAEWLNTRNFKNWKTVKELADQYWIKTNIVDRISTPEWQKAYGVYWDRMITLAKDLKESTVPHELLHATFDMVDGARKTKILEWIQKNLKVWAEQAEEWLADNFSEYYRTGKFWTKWLAKTFVEKVKQFFYEVKKYIDWTYQNEKQIRQLFDDIIDWKLEWEYWAYSDPKFQSVWHGSPYEFERFDSSHMGEWEWAQAHWWGHYVAVDEKTAEWYASKLNMATYKWKPTEWWGRKVQESDYKNLDDIVVRAVLSNIENNFNGVTISDAINDMKDYYKKQIRDAKRDYKQFWYDNAKEYVKKYEDLYNAVDRLKEEDFSKQNRNLYELDIPDPVKRDTPTWTNYWEEDGEISKAELKKINNELLKREWYWDYINDKNLKPVSDMTKEDIENIVNKADKWIYDKVLQEKEIAEKRFQTSFSTLWELFDTQLSGRLKPSDYVKLLTEAWFKPDLDFVSWKDWRAVYRSLENHFWSDKKASKFLESLWYDGIHYFWWRDWEAYVIFSDDALQITKHHKY